jgi:hypothetical protein
MGSAADTPGPAPVWVVYRIDPRPGGLFAVYVQMPNGETAVVVVPGVGVSLQSVRLSVEVVGQLWQQKRGATPLAEPRPAAGG